MLELRILGPLEVCADGRPVEVRGARQRALLGSLLLHAGRPVGASALVASVWGDAADDRAAHALHEAVSQLRRTLARQGLAGLVVSGDGSYRVGLDGCRLDALEFEELLVAGLAAHDVVERAGLLRDALDRWRGDALSDVALEGDARAECERLRELRLTGTLAWAETLLDAGDDAAPVPELERAAREHPYDERVCELLMHVLYRAGRQADALRQYHELRARLRDDLGLDPGRRLRDLERAILRHDAVVAAPRERPHAPSGRRRRGGVVAAAALVAAAFTVTAVALTHGTGPGAVYSDSLRGEIDTGFWDLATTGRDVSIAPGRDGVRLTIGAHALPDATGEMKVHLASYCALVGDFDAQVDYRLHTWSPGNGVTVGMYIAYADVLRSGWGHEAYVGAYTRRDPPDGGRARRLATTDRTGTLRITRLGDRIEERARTGGRWRLLAAARVASPSPAAVYLEAWTSARRFVHRQVDVDLSNFRLLSGAWSAPAFGGPPGGCPTS